MRYTYKVRELGKDIVENTNEIGEDGTQKKCKPCLLKN
jgi:hypothetical protein